MMQALRTLIALDLRYVKRTLQFEEKRKMTTQSSQQERKKIQMSIGELTIKFTKCVDLVNQGKRSDAEIAILNQALQLFREARLAGAMAKVICEAKECPGIAATEEGEYFLTRLQKIFSIRVEESALPVEIRYRLEKMGIMYIGEILMIIGGLGKKINKEMLREFFVSALGTEVTADSAEEMLSHWKPPYWRDPQIKEKLDLPVYEVFNIEDRISLLRFIYYSVRENFPVFYEKEGIEKEWYQLRSHNLTPGLKKFAKTITFGEFLAARESRSRRGRWSGWKTTFLSEIQAILKPHLCLHAGTVLPPDWTPPQRDEPLS
jgi:hypothetical protein